MLGHARKCLINNVLMHTTSFVDGPYDTIWYSA